MAGERTQSTLTDQWMDIESSKFGWNNFVPNHWTKYAEEKGLILAGQEIHALKHKKYAIKRTRGLSCSIPIEKFVSSPWTRWYKKNTKLSTEYTISEYKKIFGRKRPDWALSFNEKKKLRSNLTINDKNKTSFVISEESRTMKSWFIERELCRSDRKNGLKVIVERIFDAHGICKSITMVRLRSDGSPFTIRQEDKLSKHVWNCTVNTVYDRQWSKAHYTKLIKLPEPWSSYF